ncbi:MAG: glycosyltransferase [Actinobacteria bacterium]|nr:glycosyltransferase [Actinomycetota bacterium]
MRPLRRFAAASALVTTVDVATLSALVFGAGVAVAAADAVAVAVASVASWVVHRRVAGAGDPFDRWVDRPAAFVVTAGLTGLVDVAVLGAVVAAGPGSSPAAARIVAGKALALTLAGTLRLASYRIGLVDDTRRHLARGVGRGAPPGDLRLTVVVPSYQEEARIGDSVRRIRQALSTVEADGGAEVLVVDDGSTDATTAEAVSAGARVVSMPANRGKGAAVREGVLAAHGRTIAFVDADLAYPPEQVLSLLREVEAGWDVVVGSRRHVDSVDVVRPSLVRSLSGRLFNLLTAVVLLGRYRDTQCGCKAFRSDVAALIFSRARIDGFAFDVEVFHLVERYRLSLTEIPVVLEAAAGSTVRVGVEAVRMVGDLFRVRRWSARGAYDLTSADAVPAPGDRAIRRPAGARSP